MESLINGMSLGEGLKKIPAIYVGVFLFVFVAILTVFDKSQPVWAKLAEYGFIGLLGAMGFGRREELFGPSVTVEASRGAVTRIEKGEADVAISEKGTSSDVRGE